MFKRPANSDPDLSFESYIERSGGFFMHIFFNFQPERIYAYNCEIQNSLVYSVYHSWYQKNEYVKQRQINSEIIVDYKSFKNNNLNRVLDYEVRGRILYI